MEFLTASPTPPCPLFPPFLPPHSPLHYTKLPAWPKADCPLRRVSCKPMTSHPSRSYTLKTSSARPTPCVPSTAIVQTLCVASAISRPPARARFLLLLCRRRRLSALPRRLRLRAKSFLLFATFSFFSPSLSPFLPCILLSRRGFSHPTLRRPVHLPSPGRTWCLLTGSSPSSRSPRRCCTVLCCTVLYASFDVLAVGTNSLTCGFN